MSMGIVPIMFEADRRRRQAERERAEKHDTDTGDIESISPELSREFQVTHLVIVTATVLAPVIAVIILIANIDF